MKGGYFFLLMQNLLDIIFEVLYIIYSRLNYRGIKVKRLLSEKRTQVYFPMSVYLRIERKAKETSQSSAAIIREAVDKYLGEGSIDWGNDPFFKTVGIMESAIGDLSERHDRYLYGKKEAVKK